MRTLDQNSSLGLPRRPPRGPLLTLLSLLTAFGLLAVGCSGVPKTKPGDTLIEEPTRPTPMRELVVFSGRVVSTLEKAVAGARVEVEGEVVETQADGYFKITAKPGRRYVLNIRKDGFGLLSRIYTTGVQEGHWIMTPGTVQSFDPTQPALLTNVRAPDVCNGPLSSQVDWGEYPSRRVPHFIDGTGAVSNVVSDEIRSAIAFVEQGDTCNSGISLSLPANSLVSASGTPPVGDVRATISTVDIYDPYSMPGDYTVIADEARGYMVTFGAGGIVMGDEETSYQLKKGAVATLTIPINRAQLRLVERPEETIPLLLYDEKEGVWKKKGVARLNDEADAYVAKLSHLSTFNMDLVKTDQACLSINSETIAGDYFLEVTFSYDGDVVNRSYLVDNTPEKLHAVYNLPSYTDVALRAFEPIVGVTIPITDTIVVNTGAPQNPATPNLPD